MENANDIIKEKQCRGLSDMDILERLEEIRQNMLRIIAGMDKIIANGIEVKIKG